MKSPIYKKSSLLLVISYFLHVVIVIPSCKKMIVVNAPVTSTNAANVYKTDATATAVLTGIYSNMSKANLTSGITGLSLLASLSADELTLHNFTNQSALLKAYYTNALTSLNTGLFDFWNTCYSIIFVSNSAIEGLNNSNSLTPLVKQQLLGEAKFIRGFCYFYLVNLYGDVPLAITTNYEINRLLARSSLLQIYQQIISDLKDAQTLLSDAYVSSDRSTVYPVSFSERIHPNKGAATALLARAYLYSKDYLNAERQATLVIDNTALYDTVSIINGVFNKDSKEAIWQLQPVRTDITNTPDARLFVLPAAGPNTTSYPVYLSDNIVNSFEAGDIRKIKWVNKVTVGTNTYNYAYKYKSNSLGAPVTEYLMVLRLGEQYLIRAEARALQNDISGAKSDLNVIRSRAGLTATTASDKATLLNAILHERQVELFTEWGHRWLDLKRNGDVNTVMNIVTPKKGGAWSDNWQWYPIPQYELDKNSYLIGHQNPGY